MKHGSVLLIDDDPPTNFLHELIIRRSGYDIGVKAVNTGVDALNFLKAAREGHYSLPEMIFVDIHMPIMDGWEFLQRYSELQQAEGEKEIIIMLSTSLNPKDHQRAAEMHLIRKFYNKPLTTSTVNTLFKEYLKH